MPASPTLSPSDPASIRRQYPPWRIFQCEPGGLYPVSICLDIQGSSYAPKWQYDVYRVGESVVLSGRKPFGRPLPAKALKIITKARQMDGAFDPRRRDPAEKLARLQSAARRLTAALADPGEA